MKKKILFNIDCGIFLNNILVSVGNEHKDIYKYIKRVNSGWFLKAFKEDEELFNKCKNNNLAFILLSKEYKGIIILHLNEYKDNFESIKTLCHEIHHIVWEVSKMKGFTEEYEAKAYLFEDLLDKIHNCIIKRLK